MRKLIILVAILLVLLTFWNALVKYDPELAKRFSKTSVSLPGSEKVKIVTEESVVIDVVKRVSPSVVTVGIEQQISQVDPFDPFGIFQIPQNGQGKKSEQNIGSGFILSKDGLIVTNRHVAEGSGDYKVITQDGKKYDVEKIYRDRANDIAILKITPVSDAHLAPVEMGDSGKLQVGQLVVAIGTPLGEFKGSVTKGIVSGLGRGITTGSPFEGYVEKLENVIQTDAAINPGNSGGPLVNSSGQVIGVNTAVVSDAQNIGFAIPINIVKEALKNFDTTGGFNRAYLGVSYKMISRKVAVASDFPEGAYINQIASNSPAEKAGIKEGDIITKIDGTRLQEDMDLGNGISKKKPGEKITLTIWRDEKTLDVTVILNTVPN